MNKRIFIILSSFILISMIATSCEEEEVAVTGITFNQKNIVLNAGETDTLIVSITPLNASNSDIKMSSSNPSVVTLEANGVISAIAPGSSVITAISDNGITDSCYLTVTRWTSYNTNNSGLPFNEVSSICVDPQDNVWSCSSAPGSSGVSMLDGRFWSNYFTDNNPLPVQASHIKTDIQGNVWISTYHGIYKFDGVNWTNYHSTEFLSSSIMAMAIDSKNDIWLCNFRTGLTKFDGTNWINYRTEDGLAANLASSIAIDAQDNIWIGTDKGVSKFDGSNWTTYNQSNSGLVDNVVYSIAVDKQGNLWIGTERGASKFDGSNWKTYNSSDTGLQGTVFLIAIGTQNNIWFYNTTNWYLTKFDGTRWINYTNEILSQVYSIGIDKQGNKWLATWGGGIVKLED